MVLFILIYFPLKKREGGGILELHFIVQRCEVARRWPDPEKVVAVGAPLFLVWMLCQKSESNFLRADSFSCFPLSTWNIFTLGLEASVQMDHLNRAQSTSTQIAVSVFMGSVKLHCLSSTSPIQSNNTHFPGSKKVSRKKKGSFLLFFL